MKVAILGASGHYGRKIAGIPHGQDAISTLSLVARDREKLRELAAELGAGATVAGIDTADDSQVRRFFGSQDVNTARHCNLMT